MDVTGVTRILGTWLPGRRGQLSAPDAQFLVVQTNRLSWSGTPRKGLPLAMKFVAMFTFVVMTVMLTTAGSAASGRSQLLPAGADGRVAVFVTFDRMPATAEAAIVRHAGGEVYYSYSVVPAIAAYLPADALAGLARNPRVLAIEPVLDVVAVDLAAELSWTWGVQRIGTGEVHAAGRQGAGVRVAILDSGLDQSHPDLQFDPACSASVGYGSIHDGNGHGTHVAGTVAALRNGMGVVGVAPQVTLCVLKVLGDTGGGSYADVVAALDWISNFNLSNPDNPIRITNNSYGSGGDPGRTVRQAFERTEQAGILHIAAAGNSGNTSGTGSNCIYPARWPTVVAVAATTSTDHRASFSSTCAEVELAAPGASIRSTVPGGGYAVYNGTSMAAPHAAGVAALVMSAAPTVSRGEVRSILAETASDLGAAGRDTWFGWGLVSAVQAVMSVVGPDPDPELPGSLSGVLRAADSGSPISSASVQLIGTSFTTTSAFDGAFAFTEVAPGTYTLQVSATGYLSESRAVEVVAGVATVVDVSLTLVQADSVLVLSAVTYSFSAGKGRNRGSYSLSVHITVVDGVSGQGIGKALLAGLLTGQGGGEVTANTDRHGSVQFTVNSASGCYSFAATALTAAGYVWDGTTPSNGGCTP